MASTIGALNAVLGLNSAAFVAGTEKARGALGTFAANSNRVLGAVDKSFTGVSGTVKKFGDQMFSLRNIARATFGALGIGLGVAAVTQFTRSTLTSAAALKDQALQAGVSTSALQAYRAAMQDTGNTTEFADTVIARLTDRIGEALEGTGQARNAFTALGFSAGDLAGGAESVLPKMAVALLAISSASERARIETDLFGRTGQRLESSLTALARPTDELIKRYSEMGRVLAPEDIDRANTAITAMGAAWSRLATTAAPSIITLAGHIKTLFEWTNKYAELLAKLGGAGIGAMIGGRIGGIPGAIIGGAAGTFAAASAGAPSMSIREMNALRAVQSARARGETPNPADLAILGLGTGALLMRPAGMVAPSAAVSGPRPVTTGGGWPGEATPSLFPLSPSLFHEPPIVKMEELETKTVDVARMIQTESAVAISEIRGVTDEFIKAAMDGSDQFATLWGSAYDQVRYSTINAFVAMEDMLVRFVATGKLEIKSLVQYIIAEFARIVIHKNIIGPISDIISAGLPALFGGARAAGGPVTGGRAYIVGEGGPELFMPGSSGQIIPSSRGSVSIINNFNIDARGAEAGMEKKIAQIIEIRTRRAILAAAPSIINASVAAVSTRAKRRGGRLG